ncbi:organic cation transporter protein-like [Gigantopelta aegis]|uniref:organic cation transporter protein-like n=1 Tax=Gigantopelta aegis TaxID=1735272 RepID=UPI001B88CD8B|nr:organic cation transporter protein-like [Gigantopelta aegis]
MKFDSVFEYIGEFGTYQKRIYFLVCLPAISTGIQMLMAVFILNVPDHRCGIPGVKNDTFASQGPVHASLLNYTIPWKKDDNGDPARASCERYSQNLTSTSSKSVVWNSSRTGCTYWVYDRSVFKETIITEMNLVCNQKELRAHANMVLMGGILFGAIFLGLLSDAVGRKVAFMLSVVVHAGVCIGTSFVTNFYVFMAIRFFVGASSAGLFMGAFVIGMELVGPSKRTFAGIVIEIFWCLGLFTVGGVAYALRDWHHLQLACSVPTVLLFSYYWLIPESPRWLLSKGRYAEAEAIIQKAAQVNGVKLPDKLFDKDTLDENTSEAKIWEMFTSPTLLIRSLIIFINWLVVSMVYYGLGLNVGNLGGDVFLNFTIANIVELVSYFLCIALLDRVGRKLLHCGSMLLGGVACVATLFPVIYGTSDHEWITVTLSMIGKLGASAAFAIIYVFAAELFPTVVRNSGMGASSFCARIGGMASPYIADLGTLVDGEFSKALPLLVFGGSAIFAGILSLWLPETLDRVLPETIDDAKNFGKRNTKHSYEMDIKAPSEEANGKWNPSFDDKM